MSSKRLSNHYFNIDHHHKEKSLSELLLHMYNVDFHEASFKQAGAESIAPISTENKKFLKLMETEVLPMKIEDKT